MNAQEPMDDGFVDMASLQEVIRQAEDRLRSIGLTLNIEGVAAMLAPDGSMVLNLPCTVRPSAKKKLVEDREAREQFNRMMAEQNRAMIEEKKQKLAELLKRGVESIFEEDDECSHERRHPDGFCLDCGEGMKYG